MLKGGYSLKMTPSLGTCDLGKLGGIAGGMIDEDKK